MVDAGKALAEGFMSYSSINSVLSVLSTISGHDSESVLAILHLALAVACMIGAVSVGRPRRLPETSFFKVSKSSVSLLFYVVGAFVSGLAFGATYSGGSTGKAGADSVVADNVNIISGASFENAATTRVVYAPNEREGIRVTQTAYTVPGGFSESRAYGPDSSATPKALFVAPAKDETTIPAPLKAPTSEEVAPTPLSSANVAHDELANSRLSASNRSAASRAYGPEPNVDSSSVAVPVMTSEHEPDFSSDVLKAFQPENALLPRCFAGANAANPISSTGFASSRAVTSGATQIGVSELSGGEPRDNSLLTRLDEEKARVSREVRPAVLTINAKRIVAGKPEETHGSGFAVQYKGRIVVVTNSHVIEGAESCRDIAISTYDGQTFSPIRVLPCEDFDIAALEIDLQTVASLSSLRLCRLANSSELEAGFGVFTIGAPLFMDWTMTYCHVGKVYRNTAELKEARIIKETSENGDKDLVRYIQISGIILEGNSGGPLFNACGDVVGIVTATIQKDSTATGIGFAIPIEDALSVVRNMVDSGAWRRSYLGVVLDGSRSSEYVLEHGVGLSEVKQNSPAELAGVRVGDHVRTFNGERVRNKFDLARMIALTKPGEKGSMEIVRDGRPITITFSTCSGVSTVDAKTSSRQNGTTIRR